MRRVGALLVVALAVLCAGCRSDISVSVDARADGSGQVQVEVVVDKAVTDRIDLGSALRVDDLRQAEWSVEGPLGRPGGDTAVVATKSFRSLAEANQVLAEISGPDGPFKGLSLHRRSSTWFTTTELRGTVDFTKGVEAFGDADIRQRLGGSDVGIAIEQLNRQAGQPVNQTFHLQVTARLPGTVHSTNATTREGDEVTWRPALDRAVQLEATSRSAKVGTITVAVVGAAVAAIVLLTAAVVVVRRRRRRVRPLPA